MPGPTVSVIVPAFNRARWLPLSIGSVLHQTFADWELLVVDDGSTDDSPAVVRQLQHGEERIRYLTNQRRKGPAGARNQGMDEARGRYFAFLDSDDAWEPFHLQEMTHYLDAYPERLDVMTANPLRKNFATGEVIKFDELDLELWRYEKLEDAYILDRDMLFPMALKSRVVTTQALVVRREACADLRWDEELVGPEDCLMPLEIARRRLGVAHLQRYHVVYWMHDDNLTNCAGRQETSRRIALNLGFELFYRKVLGSFPLTPEQRGYVEGKLAEHCVWHLAYNGYMQQGDFRHAREYIRKGLRLRPWNARYWKTYLGTFAKQLTHGGAQA